MAVVSVKSKSITNRDATPSVSSNANYANGMLRELVGACAVTSGDSTGSKYFFGSIPSNARVSDILVSSPDIGTTTTMDIGLYRTTKDGGAVVDADFFTAAFVLNAGAVANSQVAYGNVMTLANSEKMVWELLGLSSDPCISYDLIGTLVGAADGTGTVMVKGRYAI